MERAKNAEWLHGLHSELAFWRGQLDGIASEQQPNLGWRLWPREFEARYMEMIPLDRRSTARVLDVGSGPFTHHGSLWNGQPMNLVCIDALADEYATLLSEYNINPPIKTLKCDAEELDKLFSPDSFDLVTTTNALDHTASPIAVIAAMFRICRPGGSVFIELCENEGAENNYFGLHKHNFTIENNRMLIWRPDGSRVFIDEISPAIATIISTTTDHPWRGTDWGSRFISCQYVKG